MAEERKFNFYLAGAEEEAEVSFFNWHTQKSATAHFDENGEYSTNDSGIGEAIEMLADSGHPLIRTGSRPAAKKGA